MGEIDLVTWYLVKFALAVGPWGIALLLAAWSALCVFAGYRLEAKLNAWEKPMEAQKFDHIKTDILPDGSLSPGDNSNLEGPE